MRKFTSIKISNVSLFKKNLLRWANGFQCCAVLVSNEWQENANEMIVAAGKIDEIVPTKNSFESLNFFHQKKNDWLFGFLSYDLKNETEDLASKKFDGVCFPQMHFFQPESIFIVRRNRVEIGMLAEHAKEKEAEDLFHKIMNHRPKEEDCISSFNIISRTSKKEYIRSVNEIRNHIQQGDIYEMNYCMEFYSENSEIIPEEIFFQLNETSQTPFSAYYRLDDKYMLCASPERFLKKSGDKIISQPIKGTAKREKTREQDVYSKDNLFHSKKERSENVMIVDLVRNDLSKTCHSVCVEELYGIYTFKHWHQMISTVSGVMRPNIHFTEVIKNAFPMGSMTGAPKIRAMELIERYEQTKRGLYSGAAGYITPDGDFDFNVVIRSILYNSSSKYLSFHVGSAITANSDPDDEYKECLLKAKGMFEALRANDKLLIEQDEPNTFSHA